MYENLKDRKDAWQIGIYGIYIEDQLIYIGKTETSFNQRFKQHKRAMENGIDSLLYNLMRTYKEQGYEVNAKALLSVKNIRTSFLTKRDLEAIELGLIALHQPIANIEGVSRTYSFK